MAERLRFETTVLDMDSVQLRDIVKPTVVVVVISTAGQGEMPQNARRLWRTLLSSALKPGLLRKVCFTSFGLGDSSYPRFNVAHRMLHGRLVQLGAQTFCGRGEGNEQHPEGHSAGFRAWVVTLKEKLMEAFPLPDGELPISDEVFLEPKWKLALVQVAPPTEQTGAIEHSNGINGCASLEAANESRTDGSVKGAESVASANTKGEPSPELLPIKGAYTSTIMRNERVTAPEHFQDTRLLDLQVTKPYAYGPGAVAVLYPKNFPPDIHDVVSLMGWQNVADRSVTLVTSTHSITGIGSSPSPLRHLDITENILTLRWLLENVLDIMSVPRRSFFASLVHFAGSDTEDGRYQKERLLELANPELIDELWDYTTRPKRTIVEVMMDFTTIKIPWQYVLSVFPLMKGRQFSIASGGHLRQDDVGNTKVELLVAIADPPSPIIKYRRRYGVCTRYITALQAGQQITIGLQQGYLDVQPAEMDVPVVMIGPGTGIAPMRSMIYQRLEWARGVDARIHGKRLAGDILIFGCRSPTADYYFGDEWECLKGEGLTVWTAFSRDLIQPKQYVQDLIRLNAASLHDALVEKRGKVYVCGSSGNMPKSVREALVDVLAVDGTVMKEEAEAYLDEMEKGGRYKQETW
ncbi:hypothetical protein LTR08_006698 [Meristemomyces frigidus]|nr:hypothetical protein LTR08_006698 [Meristemomyces frigidus]